MGDSEEELSQASPEGDKNLNIQTGETDCSEVQNKQNKTKQNRKQAALPEGPGWIPSSNMAAYNHL